MKHPLLAPVKPVSVSGVMALAARAVDKERRRCIKICEDYADSCKATGHKERLAAAEQLVRAIADRSNPR